MEQYIFYFMMVVAIIMVIYLFTKTFLTKPKPGEEVVKDRKYYSKLYESEVEKLKRDGKLRYIDNKQIDEIEFIPIIRTIYDLDQALELYVLIKKTGSVIQEQEKKHNWFLFENPSLKVKILVPKSEILEFQLEYT